MSKSPARSAQAGRGERNRAFLWPQVRLARSPGRPRLRKEWNAGHRGDWISRHSANGRPVPNGCCPTDSLLIVPADLRLWRTESNNRQSRGIPFGSEGWSARHVGDQARARMADMSPIDAHGSKSSASTGKNLSSLDLAILRAADILLARCFWATTHRTESSSMRVASARECRSPNWSGYGGDFSP